MIIAKTRSHIQAFLISRPSLFTAQQKGGAGRWYRGYRKKDGNTKRSGTRCPERQRQEETRQIIKRGDFSKFLMLWAPMF